MPLHISDPAVIILLNEAYEKESRLRAQWTIKHKHLIGKAAVLNREPTNYYEEDVKKQAMVGGLAAITRSHIESGFYKKKVPIRDARTIPCSKDIRHDHSIVKVGLGDPKMDPRLTRPDTDTSLDPVMRPIDANTKKIIYKPKPGRERYLHKRIDEIPEKKYYFAECTSWDYGWRLGDSKKPSAHEHGRRWVLWRTIHSSVGPQPDPMHYRSADIPNHSRCTI